MKDLHRPTHLLQKGGLWNEDELLYWRGEKALFQHISEVSNCMFLVLVWSLRLAMSLALAPVFSSIGYWCLQYIGINTKYRGNHSITFEIFQGVCLDDWGFQTIGAATFLPDGSHVLYLKCLFCCMGWVGYIEQPRASRILNEKIWTLISVVVKEMGDLTILFTLMLSMLGFRCRLATSPWIKIVANTSS